MTWNLYLTYADGRQWVIPNLSGDSLRDLLDMSAAEWRAEGTRFTYRWAREARTDLR